MAAGRDFKPKLVGFLCNWCCYAGADLAGVSRFQYPDNIRIIRLMCSGRVDPEFVIRAFARGADGVFIGGCWLGECHYVTEGNYDAMSMMHLCRWLLEKVGIEPQRLRLEWVSASEGIRFSEVVADFTRQLQAWGPLGRGEGIDAEILALRLEAVRRLLPFVKLVERERLRVRFRTEQEYQEYFHSAETRRLLEELVAERLQLSQLAVLLERQPRTLAELAGQLRQSPAQVSRHLNLSLQQGLVKYDEDGHRYALA
ncbi:MAG: methyl-viologen-reducing hydrogenase subunit delta [Deltaproteobacteria bacterium]|nr:MAG: methyl-viologen-reducing hydrogenase subunit delta [Deltaproteobacteria bacterium]